MSTMTRRSVIFAPVVLVPSGRSGPLAVFLGDLIISLFVEVLKVGIELLITSAARNFVTRSQAYGRNQFTPVVYVDSSQAADNFCPYCTVEYATKGKKFWDGAMFTANEENVFYRSRGKPTDEVLLSMLKDGDWLWHLDATRNHAAHLPTGVLASIMNSAEALQRDKNRLYYQITQHTLLPDEIIKYVIGKPVLDELDRAYRHVTSKDPRDYHINQRYVESVVILQRYVTWFNLRLMAVETATSKPDLFA